MSSAAVPSWSARSYAPRQVLDGVGGSRADLGPHRAIAAHQLGRRPLHEVGRVLDQLGLELSVTWITTIGRRRPHLRAPGLDRAVLPRGKLACLLDLFVGQQIGKRRGEQVRVGRELLGGHDTLRPSFVQVGAGPWLDRRLPDMSELSRYIFLMG